MFEFLKPDFLNTSAQKLHADESTKFHSTLQDHGVTEALIQTVWKDVERLHQLPPGAVVCDVIPALRRYAGAAPSVQLTVMQWSAALAMHLFALQSLLRTGLDRYEPGFDHSNVSVVWRFDDQCGCPYTGIADGIDWTGPAAS
jgi:hypothetical protein